MPAEGVGGDRAGTSERRALGIRPLVSSEILAVVDVVETFTFDQVALLLRAVVEVLKVPRRSDRWEAVRTFANDLEVLGSAVRERWSRPMSLRARRRWTGLVSRFGWSGVVSLPHPLREGLRVEETGLDSDMAPVVVCAVMAGGAQVEVKSVRLSVFLPLPVVRALKVKAARAGVSVSDLVARLVDSREVDQAMGESSSRRVKGRRKIARS